MSNTKKESFTPAAKNPGTDQRYQELALTFLQVHSDSQYTTASHKEGGESYENVNAASCELAAAAVYECGGDLSDSSIYQTIPDVSSLPSATESIYDDANVPVPVRENDQKPRPEIKSPVPTSSSVYCTCIKGFFVVTFVLVSLGALALAINNYVRQNNSGVEQLQFSSDGVDELQKRVKSLEMLVAQMQMQLDLYIDTDTQSLNDLDSRLNSTNNALTAAQLQLPSLERGLNATALNAVDILATNISLLQSHVSEATSSLRSLETALSTPVNLYGRCFKNVATCTVRQHPRNPYWYFCSTPQRRVNIPNYYLLSSHCQHDPDTSYIDTSSLEVISILSDTYLLCKCNVVGLTSNGSHGSGFNPIPRGVCTLVVTQCPLTQTLFNP